MAEVRERIQKWDILKFVLIFFVVLGHIGDQLKGTTGLFIFTYSFHMPLFIFVSGLFSKRTINEKRYDKIFSYFVLYLFIKVLEFFTGIIFDGTVKFSLFSENGLPWYAFVLFVFCLITVFLKNIDPKYVFAVSLCVALLSGYDSSLNTFLMLSRTMVFYPIFYLGYVLDPDTVAKTLDKKWIKIVSVIGIIAYMVIIYFFLYDMNLFRNLLSGQNPYRTLKFYPDYGILYRLVHYLIVACLGAMIISLIPDKLGKGGIARIGGRSVQIYALHYIFIELLYKVIDIDVYLDNISPILTKVVMLPVTVLIILICSSKIWTPIFDFILKPKLRRQ